MNDIQQVIFENNDLIVECEAERDESGVLTYCNILITNKESGRTYEALELPDGVLAVAEAVANASLKDE